MIKIVEEYSVRVAGRINDGAAGGYAIFDRECTLQFLFDTCISFKECLAMPVIIDKVTGTTAYIEMSMLE